MNHYNITITREGRWWMVEIPELDGLTQARRFSEAELMAREWIALMSDAELKDVSVTIASVIIDGRDFLPEVRALGSLRSELHVLNDKIASTSQSLARELVDHAVPVRDAGALMDVSPQRVSQLAAVRT